MSISDDLKPRACVQGTPLLNDTKLNYKLIYLQYTHFFCRLFVLFQFKQLYLDSDGAARDSVTGWLQSILLTAILLYSVVCSV